jgi:O-antigen/teichoic acid export membrane protein
VLFGAKMLSVATGMMFTLLITRNTTQEQVGIWSNVFDLAAYFMLLATAIPFWSGRFVAREKEGALKTGFVANLIIGLISVGIFIPLVPAITLALNVSEAYLTIYFIASVQIVQLYLINALEAGLRAKKPQAIGYGLLIVEICKLILAYVLLLKFHEPLLGAIIGLVASVFIQIPYYMKLLSDEFKQKIQWNYVREWLKGSILNIYYLIGAQIAAVLFILLFVFGGAASRGEYAVATTISNIISYSIFLSFALYPKLLAENSLENVPTSLKMVLMFAIPMTAGVLATPDSFLIILRQEYKEVAPLLSLLAVDSFIATISQFFIWVVFGVEKLDEEAKIPLKRLIKSNIFKVYTLSYIHAAITLPIAYFVLTNFALNQSMPAAIYVAIINMATRFAMFLILCVIVYKTVRIKIPWKSIAKYCFASAIMAIVLFLIPHQERLSLTLGVTAMGAILYFGLLMAIDKETRKLAGAMWQEIKSRIKPKN